MELKFTFESGKEINLTIDEVRELQKQLKELNAVVGQDDNSSPKKSLQFIQDLNGNWVNPNCPWPST